MIAVQPTLAGERLELRPFRLEDAATVRDLAGALEVASTTLTIPHPYEDGMAEEWIRSHAPAYAEGSSVSFAIVERSDRQLVGAIGLTVKRAHSHGEIGYWTGVPYWNRGYATEAGELVLRFGFESLGLNRIFAHHFVRNPASGRVMQKLGMQYEGRLRQHVQRWGTFEDLDQYGILLSEWRVRYPLAGG